MLVATTMTFGLVAGSAHAEFRHLGPPPDNTNEDYTFAWGTSVGGAFVAGEANVANCGLNTIGQGRRPVCTMAAVWAPNFGSSPALDEPFILPLLTAGLPDLRDRYWSQARAIDADGDTIVGRDQYDEFVEVRPGEFSNDGERYRAIAWTRNANAPWSNANAQATELKPDGDHEFAGARGVSDDGNYAVGWMANYGDPFNDIDATLWVRRGATAWDVGLDILNVGGQSSVANGVAVDDGKPVVVGWIGSVDLRDHVLSGSDNDRNVFEINYFRPRAFVWEQATGMEELQRLSNGSATAARSDATAISADAKTIVGWSDRPARNDGDPFLEAVRWTRSGNGWSAAQGLGVFDLPQSLAATVQDEFSRELEDGMIPLGSVALAVSEHGKAVAGYQAFGRVLDRRGQQNEREPRSDFRLAYFWSEEHGAKGQYLGDVLKADGVDIGPWVLFTATGVREEKDFFVIVGDGSSDGRIREAELPGYIARIGRDPDAPDGNPASISGFTTPAEQIVSFSAVSSATLAIGTNFGSTLNGLNEMVENHRCIRPQDAKASGWCFFTFGTGGFVDEVDSEGDGQFAGDVGIAHYFTPVSSVGVTVGAGQTEMSTFWDGSVRSTEFHMGGYAAHMPDTGLRLFGAGLWGDLSDVDITRGYLNGVGVTNSFGNTEGEGWGVMGRIGWGFRATDTTLLTPFAELTYTDAQLDGFRETGGPFPTTFQDVSTNTTVGRIGILEETDLTESIRVFTSLAWAQVLDRDDPVVRGAVLDIFELSTDTAGTLDGWAEIMAGARYQLNERGVFSVSGNVATEFDEYFTLGGRVGYSQTF